MTWKFLDLSIQNWLSSFLLPLCILVLAGYPADASPTPTVTNLVVTSEGTPATTVASGNVVILTATVNAGPTAITVGQVNFCDATAPLCTDVHLVGTAQLTKAGSATLKFKPGVGSHSYNAIFHGTSSIAASTSSTATLLVTGAAPTTTSIASSGSSGNYQLTAKMAGIGSTVPSGTVSFLDTSNNNSVLGTAMLGNGVSGLNFVTSWNGPPRQVGLATNPLVGDFNGDGNLDLIESGGTSAGDTYVTLIFVLLGNGDGTFSYSPIDSGGQVALAGGDFNGDGILDLLVTSGNSQSDTVTVWLGNGDGTFTPTGMNASIGPSGSNPWSGAVGDFNGDGILDAAILVNAPGGTSSSLTVLLGNGNGAFTPAATSTQFANFSRSVTIGDFNGDGILDIAVISKSNAISTFLGNGDGTFSPVVVSTLTGSYPYQIVTGDFNQDGKLDLLVANGVLGNTGLGNSFSVLLGNGDGTFTLSGSSLNIPIMPECIAVGDFNGDGKADVFVVAQMGLVYVLEGNGDGTFAIIANPAPQEMSAEDVLAAGDFNGDGASDVAVVYLGGEVTVQLSTNQRATAMATGVSVPVATGTHQAIASYAGDNNYKASTSGVTGLVSAVGTSTIGLTPSASPVFYGAAVTLTAAVKGDGLAPTGTVTFIEGIRQLDSIELNDAGIAPFTSTTLAVGSHSIWASYAGDSNHNASDSTTIQLTVTPVGTTPSTLTATPALTTITDQQTDTVTISVAGSGDRPTPAGEVTLASSSFSATQTLSGGSASFTIPAGTLSDGANSFTATYPGDATFASASATTTITVSQVAIAAPSPSSPISPGASATANVTLLAGSNYSGTMNLSCSLTGSPTGAQSVPTCSLKPATIALLSGGSATSVLTLATTSALSSAMTRPSESITWKLGSGGTLLVSLLLIIMPSQRRYRTITLALLWMIVAFGAAGCGGSDGGSRSVQPGTPATTAGTYAFIVSGSDSNSSKIFTSTSITITVQ
jgi:hypothetical protein